MGCVDVGMSAHIALPASLGSDRMSGLLLVLRQSADIISLLG
jgi:hypothetical protein